MILGNMQGSIGLEGNFFFFAADEIYFDDFGKALAKSLKAKASWANIHVHLYNPRSDQLEWCAKHHITASFETVNKTDPNFSTICACVRFIRIPEIFSPTAKIIAFDCDVIANKDIPKSKFNDDTVCSKVTVKKNGRALASAISFGPDSFRFFYRDALLEKFNKDEIYWFLDQDILDRLIADKKVETMSFGNWTGTKMTENQIIWTAKGSRKFENEQYSKLLNYYNSQE